MKGLNNKDFDVCYTHFFFLQGERGEHGPPGKGERGEPGVIGPKVSSSAAALIAQLYYC